MKAKSGLKLKSIFMNWVAPLPWANSFMSPEVVDDGGGELAKGQTKIRREELGKIPCGDAEDVTGRQWKHLAGVHRHQRSGVLVDGRSPVTL